MRTTAAAIAVVAVLLGSHFTPSSAGDLQGQISSGQSTVSTLQNAVAAESARISQTAGGLQEARRQLDVLQAQLDAREAQLTVARNKLLAARNHLVTLENRLRAASKALAANLVAGYEGSRPDLVSVILNAHGFNQLLEQVGFLQRIGRQDAGVVASTQAARAAVARQATMLATLERRDQALARQILLQRNQVAVLHDSLLRRQITQLKARARDNGKLDAANGRLHTLEARAAEQARRAAEAAAAAQAADSGPSGSGGVAPPPGGIAQDAGGMVQPPPGAPAAVAQVIAAGNAIATLPYVWGGGHGSFQASGYDCSGSVSYALGAAGLLSSPLDSTGFESWGEPGPGRWITVYANADHAYMVVAGWRFDTVALAEDGTRWSQSMGEDSGEFVARHPPGL